MEPWSCVSTFQLTQKKRVIFVLGDWRGRKKNGNRGIKGCVWERGRGEEDPPHPPSSSPSVQSGFILCPIAPAGANLSSFRFLAATSPQTRCLSIKHMAWTWLCRTPAVEEDFFFFFRVSGFKCWLYLLRIKTIRRRSKTWDFECKTQTDSSSGF